MAIVCDVRIVTILKPFIGFFTPLLSGNWPIRTAVTVIKIALIVMVTCYSINKDW